MSLSSISYSTHHWCIIYSEITLDLSWIKRQYGCLQCFDQFRPSRRAYGRIRVGGHGRVAHRFQEICSDERLERISLDMPIVRQRVNHYISIHPCESGTEKKVLRSQNHSQRHNISPRSQMKISSGPLCHAQLYLLEDARFVLRGCCELVDPFDDLGTGAWFGVDLAGQRPCQRKSELRRSRVCRV